MQGNFWEADPVAPAPQQRGYVSRPADPKRPYQGAIAAGEAAAAPYQAPRARADLAGQEFQNRLTQAQIDAATQKARADAFELAEKQRKAALDVQHRQGARSAVHDIRKVTQTAREGIGYTRKGAGGWGAMLGILPESDARSLANKLSTVGGNVAFEKLSQMRQESPTGGALGSVTEGELRLLRDSIAALDKFDKPEELQAGLQGVVDAYERVLFKLPEGQKDFKKRAMEMMGKGADLDSIRGFFEDHGKVWTQDNAAWAQRGVMAANRKRQQRVLNPGPGRQGQPVDDVLGLFR